jgi:hypothetical protein
LGNLQDFLNLRVLFPPNVPERRKNKNKQKQDLKKNKNSHNKGSKILRWFGKK